MKAQFLLVLSLTWIAIDISAQNPKLDEKGGFKDLKIGDTFSKWKNAVRLVQDNDSTKHYQFDTKVCCDFIFDQPVEILALSFKKERLVKIEIATKRKEVDPEAPVYDMYQKFREKFNALFGEQYALDIIKGKVMKGRAQWLGEKTFLDFTYYWDMTKFPAQSEFAVVAIYDLRYFMKDLGSEGF